MTQNLQFLPLSQTMPLLNPIYPPQYYEDFTQLKKHMELKLFDQRANQLAQLLIPSGQTNYNCWYVKKMCYLNKVVSFQHQMQFSEMTLYDKVKNFQLWEHRRFLLQSKQDHSHYLHQFNLIDKILQLEPKNYHAWSHRVWLVDQVHNYQHELAMTNTLLKKDYYNNSVWAYRNHLMHQILTATPQNESSPLLTQITFAICTLEHTLNNQAAWNYIRGFLPSMKLKSFPCQNPRIFQLKDTKKVQQHLLQFVKQKLNEITQKSQKDQDLNTQNYFKEAQLQLFITLVTLHSQNQDTIEFAKNACQVLAEKDKQRVYYWKWVEQNI